MFKKLNNKGFGHLELLIVIVVVALVAGTGFFVYQHHKKHDVAHAGSWQTMGVVTGTSPFSSVTRYGCEVGPVGASTMTVNELLVANKTNKTNNYATDSIQMVDYSAPNFGGTFLGESTVTNDWLNGEVQTSLNLNPYNKNYVTFSVFGEKGSTVSKNSSTTREIYYAKGKTPHDIQQC